MLKLLIISSEEDTTGKYETTKRSIAVVNFDKEILSFSVLRYAAKGKFSSEQ